MSILTIKQARKTITLIAQAGRKLDERIHSVAVAGLHHFFESGDLDILSDLVLAMPKSARGNALTYWITMHAPVKWDKKARAGKQGYKKNGEIPENWGEIVESANAEPFFNKTDTEQAVFDPDKYAKAVVSKLNKEGFDLGDFIAKLDTKLLASKPAVEAPSLTH